MDTRLAKLLTFVIEEVIKTGEPVGSQHLVNTCDLDMSPATVRNWFAELETEGYITQPHTSAGRIPTEKGYRLYVDELMDRKPLSKRESNVLETALLSSNDETKRMKAAAKISAEIAHAAAIVGVNESDTYYTGLSHLFAQPEFRDWGRMVTMGEVLDRLDEVLQTVRRTSFDQPIALIGKQCPFGNACSVLLLTTPNGMLFGLLGPMRLNYQRGFALLSSIQQFQER